jgi:glycosyltransferase involved in cell wall biosynthesis
MLVGDIRREPGARTKYGLLFAELARRVELVDVVDMKLRGWRRLANGLRSFHPNRRHWRERFYKNPAAFRSRSAQVAAWRRAIDSPVDAILQVGALFDAGSPGGPPLVIYTDYTAALSAAKPEAGRSPLVGARQQEWLELERRAYQRAAHVAARSRLVQCSLVEQYGLPIDKTSVARGGINFEPLPEPVSRAEDGPPTALFIGKEFRRKGGDKLLAAFSRARQEWPEARLLVVAEEPPAGTFIPDGVEWLAPTWERDTIAALFRQADLFVLPARLETWGDVLLEAMAFGLPCIASAGDAMGEIVEDGRTGRLVPVEDVASLAAALAQLFADAQLRRAWGENGRQRVEAHFRWSHVAERLAARLAESVANGA